MDDLELMLDQLGHRIADGQRADAERRSIIQRLYATKARTQVQLAEMTGLTQQAISQIIRRGDAEVMWRAAIARDPNPAATLARYEARLDEGLTDPDARAPIEWLITTLRDEIAAQQL